MAQISGKWSPESAWNIARAKPAVPCKRTSPRHCKTKSALLLMAGLQHARKESRPPGAKLAGWGGLCLRKQGLLFPLVFSSYGKCAVRGNIPER